MHDPSCPFCAIPAAAHVAAHPLAFAIRDRYPVGAGHTLIIPRRHVATWFDATADEQAALMALAAEVKAGLDASHHPDGYNLGARPLNASLPLYSEPSAATSVHEVSVDEG